MRNKGLEKIKKVHPVFPEPSFIKEASEIIYNGGIVGVPTRCLYGMAADAFNKNAVNRVFKIKQRNYDRPILLLIKSIEELQRIVVNIPFVAELIIKFFWPGRVTIIFEAKAHISSLLTAGTKKIGVRIPENPVSYALVNSCENPITGTSANLSSYGGCSSVMNMHEGVLNNLDLILDAGPLEGGIGSTIVDVTNEKLVILREGVVSEKDILNTLKKYL